MSIAKHVNSLQKHLAQFGLYPVPTTGRDTSEVFKICFLNKYEMQRWKELREEHHTPAVETQPSSDNRKKQ